MNTSTVTTRSNHFLKRAALVTALASSLVITGCSTTGISDSLYRSSEVGTQKLTKRCRVLEVRQVAIRDDDAQESGGFWGGLFGAVVGATLGSDIGGGTGNLLATELGAMAGGVGASALGSKLTDRLSERAGVEYSIMLADGNEMTSVQDLRPDDRIIKVGETCRVQMGYAGKNRVLPAEHLAGEVYRPKTTKFVD